MPTITDFEEKRIYSLGTAADTEGVSIPVDKSGNPVAEKVLLPYHIVSALPVSPVTGMCYFLTIAATGYPVGLYCYDGTEWVGLRQDYFIVDELLGVSPSAGKLYFLTVADTVYPVGLYTNDGVGWICIQQASDISLASWDSSAVSLTLVPGVLYTVTATASPASFAVTLTTSGEVTILKTGAFAIPEPTVGNKLSDAGLDALADTTNDVQIIVEKTGSTIIYSTASVVAL